MTTSQIQEIKKRKCEYANKPMSPAKEAILKGISAAIDSQELEDIVWALSIVNKDIQQQLLNEIEESENCNEHRISVLQGNQAEADNKKRLRNT